MPSQHKHQPIAFRPPAPVRDRLLAFAAETGRAVNAIVTAAVVAYLDKTGGTTAPVEVPPAAKVARPPRARKPAPAAAQESTEDEPEVFLPRCSIKGWCARHNTWHGKR